MVGTTRSRSFFMNRFRKLGFINYALGDTLHVHSSLLNVVLHDDDDSGANARGTAEGKEGGEPPTKSGEPSDKERAKRPPLSTFRGPGR